MKTGPVNTRSLVFGPEYQLNMAPGVDELAVKVAVCPGFMLADGGVITRSGRPLIVTAAAALPEDAFVEGITA